MGRGARYRRRRHGRDGRRRDPRRGTVVVAALTGPGGGRSTCVELDVDAEDAELAADRLWSLGVTAVEERPGGAGGRCTLSAGVPAGRLAAVLDGLDDRWRARVVEVDDGAWADAWRAHAAPVRVGERLVVVPAWMPDPAGLGDRDVVVRLDPGRAFGSGTHPSTRLVLAALEGLVHGGERVLDVGSGSGVLAVAAARLGAGQVVAVDVDDEAVRATAANAASNSVSGAVDARPGDVRAAGDDTFDLVVVNIGAAALRLAAAELAARTAPGGHLVLAGFLAPATAGVRAAFAGLDALEERRDGEWVALTLRARAQ